MWSPPWRTPVPLLFLLPLLACREAEPGVRRPVFPMAPHQPPHPGTESIRE